MAGYFISNNQCVFQRVVKEADDLFPLQQIKIVPGWNLVFFQKKNIENHQNCYEFAGGFIIGVGTYFFKKRFGCEALKLVAQSLISEENPFADIQGHFNFIILQQGKLSIVTDKSGHYPALRADEGGNICFSTSFVLLCRALGRIKLARQEVLEFINVAATFGGKTVAENITHLKAGHIYDLSGQVSEKKYYRMDDRKVDFDEFADIVNTYFQNYSNTRLKVACDLSAGYDTRAVASVMLFNHAPFTFFSNKRPTHAVRDLEIARSIADLTKQSLREIEIENQGDLFDDPGRLVCATELTRGLDIARRQLGEIQNKSSLTDLVVSGWGAEMLRNQHGRLPTVDLNARGFGYSRISLPDKKATARYHRELRQKFSRDIEEAMGPVNTAIDERIYYLERGRYWSASVLSVRNQYCYWSYPFFDHAIAKYFFEFKKKDERFQKKFIDHFAPMLKDVPIWDAETAQAATVSGKAKKWIKKIIPSQLMYLKLLFKKKVDQADYADHFSELHGELSDWLGFDAAFLKQKKAMRSLSKYQALLKFIGIFKDKIDFI